MRIVKVLQYDVAIIQIAAIAAVSALTISGRGKEGVPCWGRYGM